MCVCVLVDECAGLREEICVLKETSRKVEVNHHDQIAEIMREMEQVSIRHEQELADTQLKSTLKCTPTYHSSRRVVCSCHGGQLEYGCL